MGPLFFKELCNGWQDIILSKLFVIAIGKTVSSGDIFLKSERANRNIPQKGSWALCVGPFRSETSNRSAVELWHEFSFS